jgi:hypothetical protein
MAAAQKARDRGVATGSVLRGGAGKESEEMAAGQG